jgi:ligand-binding sensor protein
MGQCLAAAHNLASLFSRLVFFRHPGRPMAMFPSNFICNPLHSNQIYFAAYLTMSATSQTIGNAAERSGRGLIYRCHAWRD